MHQQEGLGREIVRLFGHNVRMDKLPITLANIAFIERVRRLREARGWTQETMAEKLGIPADRYRKYEHRTPMPIILIEPFADLVGASVHYVVTGNPDPRLPPRPPQPKRESDKPRPQDQEIPAPKRGRR